MYEPPLDATEIEWRIGLEGHSWEQDEVWQRYDLAPHKTELIDGKLYGTESDRLRVLGLLLENCGAEAAVRMGDPEIWRCAIAALEDPEATFLWKINQAHRCMKGFSSYDPEIALRFFETMTTADYTETDRTVDPLVVATREELLTNLHRLSAEDLQRRLMDYWVREVARERFEFQGQTGKAQVAQTIMYQSWTEISLGHRQTAPSVQGFERWHEDWRKTEEGWRLACRECIERLDGNRQRE